MLRFLILITAALLGASPIMAQVSVPPTVSIPEGSPWAVPVTRVGPKNVTLSFTFKTIEGTAKAGQDFVGRTGSQSVRKNAATYTINGTSIDDRSFELDESFIVEVTAKGQHPLRTFVTIRDNDQPPPVECPDGTTLPPGSICPPPIPTTGLHVGDIEIEEDAGTVTVPVWRDGDLSKVATFGYFTRNGTATAPADFSARSGTLKIAIGAARSSFTFPVVNDTLAEGHETLQIVLTSPDAPVVTPIGTITIKANDQTAPPPPRTCADGTTVPADQDCPIVAWLPAPLQGRGGYARALSACTGPWPIGVGPRKPDGTYDPIYPVIVSGVVYPVIVWGADHAGRSVYALDLGGGQGGYFPVSCLEGVRPSS